MKKKVFFIVALAFAGIAAGAQDYEKLPGGLKVRSGNVTEEVSFYAPGIVRVVKYVLAEKPAKKSYPVILNPERVDLEYTADGVKSGSISVKVAGGTISFFGANGAVLLAEKENTATFTPFADGLRSTYSVSQTWTLDRREAVFGLGQRQSGVMNHRNQKVTLQNNNTDIGIPYFTSQKGYGLYWDNPSKTVYDDNSRQGLSMTSIVGDMIDYYFMYDDGTQDGVMRQLRKLTGKATLFPLWTMGYFQCRERYASPDELCDVLDYYRDNKIPLDCIVQDWQYWGCDSNWNAMKFMNPRYINKLGDAEYMKYLPKGDKGETDGNAPRIKSPQEMVDYVHGRNARLMISFWPGFGPWTDQYKEFYKMGALLQFDTWPPKSGARVYDVFNPKARNVYWGYVSNLYNMGIDAWWTDSTEPDHINRKESDYTSPTFDGTWQSVQNAFPLVANRGIYEHQRAVKGNNTRSVQMTRSAFFGLQHYGTFSWSGDIRSNWETMKNQVPASLNYTLCGLPVWSSDIGGFFGSQYRNDPKNPAMQELQVRWMQWGTFMPIMRNHCSGPMVNEIYRFGEPGYWAYDCQKEAIELRYRIMPYLYSQMGNCWLRDETMMRPFVMDFPDDVAAVNSDKAYMLGHAMLVQPVTDNLYTWKDVNNLGHYYYDNINKASGNVRVYLPAGTTWTDFWSNRTYTGGQEIMYNCPISIMPVFVRAGSIIPFGPKVQYSSERRWNNLELRIYSGADGDYTLYEDDGSTYDYEQGKYTTIPMSWDNAKRVLTIGARRGKYKGMVKERAFRVLLVDGHSPSGDKEPEAFTATVKYDGTQTSVAL